ncbi:MULTISPECIES: DNA/RNA nuclease SfsA [Salinicola]|uniref:Sugar fermentation stimulation protein homolog n=1 Tax=Salinicola socius TaxID=404433 RepID=A0A1Q8SPC3_9GAMM|nr:MULTISPECIES: DNA/RNA nuclease SfsA [Salinicola]OLO03268.1 sugar fermentation stimulation protein SfsA [Salinicola socius]
MNYPALVPGVLLRRYKRFLADIELDDGRQVIAHCPNTGSMRAVNVPGCRVWLSESTNPARKLGWTWELIELPDGKGGVDLVSVHTGRANALVEAALRGSLVPELAGFSELKREVSVEGARLDFRLREAEAGDIYVEVKQVTLKESDGHGYFPDSVSERGRRHLEVLAELVDQGHRGVLLFCVAHTGIEDVAPAAHLDPVYARTLAAVADRGVEVLAYGCRVTWEHGRPGAMMLDRRLPVDLERRGFAAEMAPG